MQYIPYQESRNKRIRQDWRKGISIDDLAKKYDLSISRIRTICTREAYSDALKGKMKEVYQAGKELEKKHNYIMRLLYLLKKNNLEDKWMLMELDDFTDIPGMGITSILIIQKAQQIWFETHS